MPWVRIDDKAMEHPKVTGLPDGAFRLWVQGLAHCQKFLTDGHITRASLRGLRGYSARRHAELVAVQLWDEHEDGVTVHDYLQWNESREHVLRVREQARERIKRLRGKVTTPCNAVTPREQSANATRSYSGGVGVLSSEDLSSGEERGVGKTNAQRAGNFCAWYADTHERLFGVGYMGTNSDYTKALELVAKFSDRELRDGALVWFGMVDDFATKGTRSISKFASRISGCLQTVKHAGIA